MRLEEFVDEYFKFERELDLANWRIPVSSDHQLAPWPLVRFEIFRAATQIAGLYDWDADITPAPDHVNATPKGKSAATLVLEEVGLVAAPAKTLKQRLIKPAKNAQVEAFLNSEYLVLPFGRRDAQGVDKFTQFVVDGLKGNVGIIGSTAWDTQAGHPSGSAMARVGRTMFNETSQQKLRAAVTDRDQAIYQEVISRCETLLNVELDKFNEWPEQHFVNFLSEFDLWRAIFAKCKAKKIFLAISHGMALIGAARASNIDVVEIQHGLFNPYPMRFNWPGSPEVPYLPNEVWVWGDYWVEGFELIAGQKVRVMGENSTLKAARAQHSDKLANQIAFIAQPAGGGELFEAAVLTAKMHPEWRVVFRLHPGHTGSEFYEALEKAGSDNLTISSKEPGILQLLAESRAVVGIFSTTLIEAAALGTPSVILKTSSWQRLKHLVDSGDAILAEKPSDIPSAIERAKLVHKPEFFYAPSVELKDLLA